MLTCSKTGAVITGKWWRLKLSDFFPDDEHQNLCEAAHAVKRASPKLRVGGPATCAGAAWISDFRNFTSAGGVPVDFITTHTYTGGNDHINDAKSIYQTLTKARNASHVLLLLYNQATRGDPIHDCAVTVRAGSAGVHSAASTSTVYRIDQDHAAPKAAWESLGAPQWPTA